MYLKFKKTHESAVLPQANNKDPDTGDSGYDLTAVENVQIPSKDSCIVPVGLTLADISPGYWLRIEPRSGLGFKHSIQPHLGVIDNGYRGDLGVKLYNFSTNPYVVQPGDKIAQLVVYQLHQATCSWSDHVTETARGDKGFGSSDKPLFKIKQQDDDWYYSEMLNRPGYGQLRDKVSRGEYIPNPMKIDEGDPDFVPNPDFIDPTCNDPYIGRITKNGNVWTYVDSEVCLVSPHQSDKEYMEYKLAKHQRNNDS
jgi:dUTP pyrophosphatase